MDSNLDMALNILNVPPNATRKEIDRLYAERVSKCRPDINGRLYTTEYKAVQAAYNTIIASLEKRKSPEVYVDSPQFKLPKREEVKYKAQVFKRADTFDARTFNTIFERSKVATQQRLASSSTETKPVRIKPLETSSFMSSVSRIQSGSNGDWQWREGKDPRCMKIKDFEREAENTVVLTDRDVSKADVRTHWSQLSRDLERLSIRDLQAKTNDQLRLR